MALKLYDTLTPGGDYPLVDAEDVLMPDGSRLSEFKGFAGSGGVDPAGVDARIATHNTAADAHNDLRQLIEQVTTDKVSVEDVVDNLTTPSSSRPLSARQGVVMKEAAEALAAAMAGKLDSSALSGAVETALTQAKESGAFDGISPVISVRSINGGHEVSVTDAEGTKTFSVMDGKDGESGSGSSSDTTERPETVVLSEQMLTLETLSSGRMGCTVMAESFMEAGVRTVVEWNGDQYVCTAAELPDRQDTVVGNLSMYGGGEDTGEPFYVVALSGDEPTLLVVANTIGPHRVSIHQGGSGGFGGLVSLPDSVPRIEDRASSMTFAETPEHHFDAMGNTWWKVSDLTPTTEELLTTVFSMQFGDTGGASAWVPSAEELLLDTELFTGVQSAAYSAGFLVCRADGEHAVDFGGAGFSLNIPSVGIYFGYPAETAVPEDVVIRVAYTELHKLDARLLPDGFETLVNGYIDTYLSEALGGEY